MNAITKPEELMGLSVRQGLTMNYVEAEIVLGYLAGHDFGLEADENFQTVLHDIKEDDDHSGDEPQSIRDVIEFCQEMNEELLLEESGADEPRPDYLTELRKDEFILDGLMERAKEVIPAVVREYTVNIVETLRMKVFVEAASRAEAETKVEALWKEGEYILDAEHFVGVMFNVVS